MRCGKIMAVLAIVGMSGALPSLGNAAEPGFRSSDVLSAQSPPVQAVAYMDKLLRERSGGRLGIESLGENSKDSESYTISQVRNGAIDMARVSLAALGATVPQTTVLSLPFLFKSRSHMRRVIDSSIGDEILADMEQEDLIGLCFYDAGARSFYGKVPIRSAADMKGLTVQVPASELSAEIVRALGATPIPTPFYQTGAALETGAASVADNTLSAYASGSLYRIAPYFSLTEHSRAPSVLIFSKKVWDGLPPADRALIRQAAKDSVPVLREKLDTYEAAARRDAQAAGVQIIEDVDRNSFADIFVPLRKKLLPTADLQSLADRIETPEIAALPDPQQVK